MCTVDDVLKPPGNLLLTVLVQFLLNVIWSRCSCRILYSIVSYLYVSCSGLITSVGEERDNLSAIVYL